MLAIRMQRTGRKGHAQYRVVVQESRWAPTSGRVVARIGAYNPHSKQATLDKEKVKFYLNNGAQPSPKVARILSTEGVELPSWYTKPTEKNREIRNKDKLRKNQPKTDSDDSGAEPETAAADGEKSQSAAEKDEQKAEDEKSEG